MNSQVQHLKPPQKAAASKLIDPFNRRINYLRMSVTDRCNLRCTYCMAEDMEFLPRAEILSLEELARLGRNFVELGIEKIRLTGGEPLVRKGIVDLSAELATLPGLGELCMTTNGVLLGQYAAPLKAAGLDRLNISIDSLNPKRFKQLTRFGALNEVLDGIQAAQDAGFEHTKLNAVILKGVNDDEILQLAEFAIKRNLDISFIEEMPLGHIDAHKRTETQIETKSVKEELASRYQLNASAISTGGPSRYFQIPGKDSRIGFISPMSDNFCESCNRVRLTVEGQLLLCLGNEHSLDLRELTRQPETREADIQNAIIQAIGRKPERHYFDPDDVQIVRFMSHTGG